MTTFERETVVRMQHVDAAGIVFYPRYFEMVVQLIEDWFADGLGIDFHALHHVRGVGVPTVHIDVEFRRPSRLGDRLLFSLDLLKLKRTSLMLGIGATCRGEERLRLRQVLTCTSLGDAIHAIDIPADLRAAMSRYLHSEATR
jgi:4-hydroxybenzoyl-CoA thioesterase